MGKTLSHRTEYIDISKGLGMLAVIWGHIMLSGYTNTLVYAFHMPLFFFLSGMVYKKEKYSSITSLIKSRARSLLLPYVIFSVLSWIVWASYNYIFGLEVKSYLYPLLQTVLAQGSGSFLIHNGPLWFVTCLFIVEILYYFVSKTKPTVNILICILLAVVGHYMINTDIFNFKKLPWNIEAAMSSILFYSAGHLFSSKLGLRFLSDFTATRKKVALAIAAFLTLALLIASPFNNAVSIGSNYLGKSTIAFYLIAFCGTFSVLLISAFLEKYNAGILNLIKWIGRSSFYFMATHVPVAGVMAIIISKIINVPVDTIDHSEPYALLVFAVTLIICIIVVTVINKFMDIIKKKSEKQ